MIRERLILAFLLSISLAQSWGEADYPPGVIGETTTLSSATREGVRYFMAPYFVWTMPLNKRFEGKDREQALKETAQEAPQYLLGYAVIYITLRGIEKAFFVSSYADYKSATDEYMNKNPERVLYVDAIPEGDRLEGFAEFYFQKQYQPLADKDKVFLKVASLDGLVESLQALQARQETFDRIEIMGHGSPGKIHIGKDELSEKNLAKLNEAKIQIAKPAAELRMVSCSMGAINPLGGNGEQLLAGLGTSLLPEGGTAFAATKDILAAKIIPMRVMSHFIGVGNFQRLWMSILPNVLRDYKQARSSFISAQIAPQSCSDRLAKITRHPSH
jgi:hypothetical protein